MSKRQRRAQKQKTYVTGTERRPIARPQPPMKDARTKRNRTRDAQKRNAIKESE